MYGRVEIFPNESVMLDISEEWEESDQGVMIEQSAEG